MTLGAGDGAACDFLSDTLVESIFVEQGLTVSVLFDAQTFSFPVGEAGRAGFAVQAQMLGGLEAEDFVLADERVIYAPEGQLAAALAAASAGGASVVVAGPGTHTGDFTVPPVTTLRGAARNQTNINGRVILQNATALEDITIINTAAVFAIETNAVDPVPIRISNVGVFARDAADGFGIIVAGATASNVQIKNSRVSVTATNIGVGIQDDVGATISVEDTEVVMVGGSDLQIGVRAGGPDAEIEAGFRLDDVRLTLLGGTGTTTVGVEIHGAANGGGASVFNDVEVVVNDQVGPTAVGIAVLRSDLRIDGGRVEADLPLNFPAGPVNLLISNATLRENNGAFGNGVPSQNIQCRNVLDDKTFNVIGGTCL